MPGKSTSSLRCSDVSEPIHFPFRRALKQNLQKHVNAYLFIYLFIYFFMYTIYIPGERCIGVGVLTMAEFATIA